jgi:hypothetical protein
MHFIFFLKVNFVVGDQKMCFSLSTRSFSLSSLYTVGNNRLKAVVSVVAWVKR